jgi:hypothetical protein
VPGLYGRARCLSTVIGPGRGAAADRCPAHPPSPARYPRPPLSNSISTPRSRTTGDTTGQHGRMRMRAPRSARDLCVACAVAKAQARSAIYPTGLGLALEVQASARGVHRRRAVPGSANRRRASRRARDRGLNGVRNRSIADRRLKRGDGSRTRPSAACDGWDGGCVPERQLYGVTMEWKYLHSTRTAEEK